MRHEMTPDALKRLALILFALLAGRLLLSPAAAGAEGQPPVQPREPWEMADALQDALFRAQAALLAGDAVAAAESVAEARAAADGLPGLPADSRALLRQALEDAAAAVAGGEMNALAAARGLARGAVFWGGYEIVRQAVLAGDAETAGQWLLVRDFRESTRFTRPGADATLAVRQMAGGYREETPARVDADLLDTYQARLGDHLAAAGDASELPARRAESAGLARGYWRILQAAYAGQQGSDAARAATAGFDALAAALLRGDEALAQEQAGALSAVLQSFRAAPLSPAEQARRAGQLLRFLALTPVEYDRGVEETTVMIEFEVQEAVTFMGGARAAFADLRLTLDEMDPARAAALAEQLERAGANLDAANRKERVVTPAQMAADVAAITAGLEELFPPAWLELNADADFDVLASVLDQMEGVVRAGDYQRAESARLEAYAIFDFGPEPRLLAYAPPLVAEIDGLFWQGYGGRPGLAQALALQATATEVSAIRAELDAALAQAQLTLGDLPSAAGAIIANAAIIVFREGLEAVIILAALMASMVGAHARYRRPMMAGVLLSLLATGLTWLLAQQVLGSLVRFGERLEAVVSLIAIGVLLLITNWFFHKSYWKDWMAGFHAQKRRILSREAGQVAGLIALGFTSMYREGFETVLFLQALVLDAGSLIVLQGIALGSLAVLVVGLITFKWQAHLPYKKMLVWTGIFIGLVLMTMVGKTVHVMQAVGWVGISPLPGVTLPYWAGLWFGVYATWQGLSLQLAAAAFVIGSYYAAEWMRLRRRRQPRREGVVPAGPLPGEMQGKRR